MKNRMLTICIVAFALCVSLKPIGLLFSKGRTESIVQSISETKIISSQASTAGNDYNGIPYPDFARSVDSCNGYAVIGSPRANEFHGTVEILKENRGNWSHVATLTAPDGGQYWGEQFGYSVALDGTTLVVGAKGVQTAYIFVRNRKTGEWVWQDTLHRPSTSGPTQFGFAVAIHEDTIVVADPTVTVNGISKAGSAYAYIRSNGGWSLQQKLTSDQPSVNEYFGSACDVHKDSIAIRSTNHTSNSTGLATAYVFKNSNSDWKLEAKLEDPSAHQPTYSYTSLSIHDDTMVVGNSAHFQSLFDMSGAVYVYVRNNNTWSLQQTLMQEDPYASNDYQDGFGNSVDFDGDTIVVGAIASDLGLLDHGAAHLFKRNAEATWTLDRTLTASDIQEGDTLYGFSVAVDGNHVLVGAPGEDNKNGTNAGAAYSYDIP